MPAKRIKVEYEGVEWVAEMLAKRAKRCLKWARVRLRAVERGEMTIRNTGSCLDFGRCDYFDLCTGAIGVESFNVREHAHPELED